MHRLTNLGAVVTRVSKGTSKEGFDAEWRRSTLLTVEGDLINRFEKFDAEDSTPPLARFDELSRASTAARERGDPGLGGSRGCLQRPRHGTALALTAEDGQYEDGRKGVRDQGTARDVWQTVFDAPKGRQSEMEPVAIRGSRLGLTRGRFRDPITPTDRSQSNTSW